MKLIIQIPCFNEEENLEATLNDLPSEIPGIDQIEILIIDDGSSDGTIKVAEKWGVHHIFRHQHNQGLARAFSNGLEYALKLGADIIVNTDADNQYCGDCIKDIVKPVLDGKFEMVIGARPIGQIDEFSALKKILQKVGSQVVRLFSGTDIPDAPSGFRAISREAALHFNVFDQYTYTLETIIQAGMKNLSIGSVPIRVNPKTRDSRLVKSNLSYVLRSARTILHSYLTYRPLKFFLNLSLVPLIPSLILWARYFLMLFSGTTRSHSPSLLLALMLFVLFTSLVLIGVVAELIAKNRSLLEKMSYEMKKSSCGPSPKSLDDSQEFQ